MSEIIKTELFWALIIGTTALLVIFAVIIIDRYRHPEIYSKKKTDSKGD
jgi:hypothetical protein